MERNSCGTIILRSNIIFLNGQCSGIVTRMTIAEWERREEDDDHWVFDVMDHKTTRAFEPAHVAVSDEVVTLMEGYYCNVRSHISPQNARYAQ